MMILKEKVKITIFILFSINILNIDLGFAQQDTCIHLSKPVQSLKIKAEKIYADQYNNLYLIDGFSIKKYAIPYVNALEYTNFQKGMPSSADISNPLKPMLYYDDFKELVFLDNYMQELESLSLQSLFPQSGPLLAANSVQGGIWVYDVINQNLVYLNQNLKQTSITQHLGTHLGRDISPIDLKEANNQVYLLYKAQQTHKLAIFTALGTFKNVLETGLNKNLVDVYNNNLVIIKDSILQVQNPEKMQFRQYCHPWNANDLVDFALNQDYLFLLLKGEDEETIVGKRQKSNLHKGNLVHVVPLR